MNRTFPLAVMAAAFMPLTAQAAPEFYGRANVSFEWVDELGHSGTQLESNNSRLGVRGSEDLGNGYEAVYRFEYKMDLDGDDDSTFCGATTFWACAAAGGRSSPGTSIPR